MEATDYCSYELSLKLKDCGFSGPALGKYAYCPNDPTLLHGMEYQSRNLEKDEILAPSLYHAQKWLREKSGICIDISPFYVSSTDADNKTGKEWHFWAYDLISVNTGEPIYECYKPYGTYEATLSAGIEAALNLLAGKETEK